MLEIKCGVVMVRRRKHPHGKMSLYKQVQCLPYPAVPARITQFT